jgi:hypothetical protein
VATGRLPDDPTPGRARGHQDQNRHTFRATGITAYLKNKGLLKHAQTLANHSSPRTTKLYDRRTDDISIDEVEKIAILRFTFYAKCEHQRLTRFQTIQKINFIVLSDQHLLALVSSDR